MGLCLGLFQGHDDRFLSLCSILFCSFRTYYWARAALFLLLLSISFVCASRYTKLWLYIDFTGFNPDYDDMNNGRSFEIPRGRTSLYYACHGPILVYCTVCSSCYHNSNSTLHGGGSTMLILS